MPRETAQRLAPDVQANLYASRGRPVYHARRRRSAYARVASILAAALALTFAPAIGAQSVSPATPPVPASAAPPATFEAGRALFRQYRLREALPVFQAVTAREPANADAWAWRADVARRLGLYDEAYAGALTALRLAPCHVFAESVLGDMFRPQWSAWSRVNADSAWYHLVRAARCDPSDGNPLFGVWPEAMRRGDTASERHSLRAFVSTGFLNPSVLSYGRWLLRDLPKDAILITFGDLDNVSTLALQETEQLRPDVAVVNQSMLRFDWYRALLVERYHLPIEPTTSVDKAIADTIVAQWRARALAGTLARPLTAGIPPRVGAGRFAFAGAYWQLTAADSVADTATIARAFAGIHGADFALPVVHPRDRSPVRHRTWIPQSVVLAALRYAALLDASGRQADGAQMRNWATKFAKDAGIPSDELAQIQNALTAR